MLYKQTNYHSWELFIVLMNNRIFLLEFSRVVNYVFKLVFRNYNIRTNENFWLWEIYPNIERTTLILVYLPKFQWIYPNVYKCTQILEDLLEFWMIYTKFVDLHKFLKNLTNLQRDIQIQRSTEIFENLLKCQ